MVGAGWFERTPERYAKMRPIPIARILDPKAELPQRYLKRNSSHVSSCSFFHEMAEAAGIEPASAYRREPLASTARITAVSVGAK